MDIAIYFNFPNHSKTKPANEAGCLLIALGGDEGCKPSVEVGFAIQSFATALTYELRTGAESSMLCQRARPHA